MQRASTLVDDPAPSAYLDHPQARAAPAHPGAPPEPLRGLPWPPEPASGRPTVEESAPSNLQTSTGDSPAAAAAHLRELARPPVANGGASQRPPHLHLPCISPASRAAAGRKWRRVPEAPSRVSPLHLPCISPASPLHLPCLPPASPLPAPLLEDRGPSASWRLRPLARPAEGRLGRSGGSPRPPPRGAGRPKGEQCPLLLRQAVRLRRASWLKRASTLPDDTAPSASLGHPKATGRSYVTQSAA